MSSFRPLPQELVDKIIDELGEEYRDPDHKKRPDDLVRVAGEALHACALIAKNWTGRSRVHLFKEVEVRADDIDSSLIPPAALMRYITKLEMQLQFGRFRLPPSTDRPTPFYAAPIVRLGVTRGVLGPGRAHFVEFITALSATLQTVTFKYCTLPTNMIHDIVLAHPGLKQLYLYGCETESASSDDPTGSRSSTLQSTSTNLELGIFARADWRGQIPRTTITQLPIKFCRFNFDFAPATAHSAKALIEANAESLSSLTVHISVRTSRMLTQKTHH